MDTIGKEGFSKTVINTVSKKDEKELTEEESEDKLRQFVKKNESLIKQYGMFRNYDDSRKFMTVRLINTNCTRI